MAQTQRTFKVIQNANSGYCVVVYRDGKQKLYPSVSRRRIEAIADCISSNARFITRPFTGGGLGYIAKEMDYGQYRRQLAERLLNQWQELNPSAAGSPKIGLIKTLRVWKDTSLRDAKEKVEEMFYFNQEGWPIIR